MAKALVDTSTQAAEREHDGDELTVALAGVEARVVDDPPVGALMVFSRRMSDKNPMTQLSGVLELVERWIVPDDIDGVLDAVGGLHAGGELEGFLQNDLAALVEAVSARPTSAQSS